MKPEFKIGDDVLYRISEHNAPKGTIIAMSNVFEVPTYKVRFEEDGATHTYWLSEYEVEPVDPVEMQEDAGYYDNHYQGNIQPIEIMQEQMTPEAFMGFLRGNIIKYACRVGKKDGLEKETAKILRYAEWLHEVAKGNTIDPRK